MNNVDKRYSHDSTEVESLYVQYYTYTYEDYNFVYEFIPDEDFYY